MSHWQTGKLELKCSLNILKKALINVMPEWEKHIQVDENGQLSANFHGNPVSDKFEMVIPGNSGAYGLYSDVGIRRTSGGEWEIGGDYTVNSLKKKLTGEVTRMKTLAIAQMRGYEVLRNENNEDEIITDIRVDVDKVRDLLS
ncbi:MAG: hypothetical protein WC119_01180 [Synergistaceae bacterium]